MPVAISDPWREICKQADSNIDQQRGDGPGELYDVASLIGCAFPPRRLAFSNEARKRDHRRRKAISQRGLFVECTLSMTSRLECCLICLSTPQPPAKGTTRHAELGSLLPPATVAPPSTVFSTALLHLQRRPTCVRLFAPRGGHVQEYSRTLGHGMCRMLGSSISGGACLRKGSAGVPVGRGAELFWMKRNPPSMLPAALAVTALCVGHSKQHRRRRPCHLPVRRAALSNRHQQAPPCCEGVSQRGIMAWRWSGGARGRIIKPGGESFEQRRTDSANRSQHRRSSCAVPRFW